MATLLKFYDFINSYTYKAWCVYEQCNVCMFVENKVFLDFLQQPSTVQTKVFSPAINNT